jgi:hypothetical protein
MNRKRGVSAFGLFVIMILAVVLAGCGGAANGASENQAVKDQFLAERSGGTPVAGASGQAGARPAMIGTVEKVDGNKISIKSPIDGTSSTVQLADGGKVMKRAEGTASDIKVGDTISAFGSLDGDTLAANNVQIGGVGGPMRFERPAGAGAGDNVTGAPPDGVFVVPSDGPGAGQATPPAGRGNRRGVFTSGTPGPNMAGDVAFGTVEKIDGNTLTLKAPDGATKNVRLSDSTNIQKQVEVPLSDIKEGTTIIATGTRGTYSFEATQIEIAEAFGMTAPQP